MRKRVLAYMHRHWPQREERMVVGGKIWESGKSEVYYETWTSPRLPKVYWFMRGYLERHVCGPRWYSLPSFRCEWFPRSRWGRPGEYLGPNGWTIQVRLWRGKPYTCQGRIAYEFQVVWPFGGQRIDVAS